MATGKGSPPTRKISIVFFTDTLCPWCFIEKRTLQAAMEAHKKKYPDAEFDVVYKPFYTNPLLKTSWEKEALYIKWTGGPTTYKIHQTRLQAAASKQSITLSITGYTGSSRASNILIASALTRSGPAAQDRVTDALFRGQFVEGRDVSDENWLVAVGRDAGLKEEHVRMDLDDEDEGKRVDGEAEAAREELGIEAVPCVMVQGRFKVGGYQEQDVFEGLFEKIRAGS